MERCGLLFDKAGLGTSLYFIAQTTGAFFGAILLVKLSPSKFLIFNMIVAQVTSLNLSNL